MATSRRILGTSTAPGAGPAQLYAVPSLKTTVVSSVIACNKTVGILTVRIGIARARVRTASHWLVFDKQVAANDFLRLTAGITLGPGEQVFCQASGDVDFTAFGEESDE